MKALLLLLLSNVVKASNKRSVQLGVQFISAKGTPVRSRPWTCTMGTFMTADPSHLHLVLPSVHLQF